MAPGRAGLLERADRLLEAGVDVRRPVRLHRRDVAGEVVDLAERPGVDDPVGLLVEGDDAELVAGRHRRRGPEDGLLADVDLADALHLAPATASAVERVAVAGVPGAGLVDDDDEGHVGLLLAGPGAHADG